jgi:hypothetical protein
VQLGPLGGELHAVRGRKPGSGPSGLRQGDALDQPLYAQSGQPPPGLLNTRLGGDHPVHLLGGGHPVPHQHAQRQPVPAARVHADHHGSARFPSGAAPSCTAPRVAVTAAAGPDQDPDHEGPPRSRSDNTSVDQAHIPADNRPHPLLWLPADPQVTTLVQSWSAGRHPLYAPGSTPTAERNEKWVGGTGPGWRVRGSGAAGAPCASAGAAALRRRQSGGVRWGDIGGGELGWAPCRRRGGVIGRRGRRRPAS